MKHRHRYIESMVTGKYNPAPLSFDPNKPTDADKWKLTDKDGDGIVSTQELQDYEMKEMQRIWVNRLNNFFSATLGLMAGMGLMHLFVVFSITEKTKFLDSYSPFANFICFGN